MAGYCQTVPLHYSPRLPGWTYPLAFIVCSVIAVIGTTIETLVFGMQLGGVNESLITLPFTLVAALQVGRYGARAGWRMRGEIVLPYDRLERIFVSRQLRRMAKELSDE